jgi:hypothetical protein
MNDIAVYGGRLNSSLSRSVGRNLSRELARVSGGAQLGLARIEAQAELQASKADAVAYVGSRAMQNVAMLSQLEQQLAQAVPMATSRLQGIADMAALGMADVMTDTVMRLRRC